MNDKHRWDNNPREYNYTEYRRVDSVNRIVAKVYKSGLRGEWVYGPSSYLSQNDAIAACEKDFPTKVDKQPKLQYREPTIEDADELCKMFSEWRGLNLSRGMIGCLKQLNFVRKVQP